MTSAFNVAAKAKLHWPEIIGEPVLIMHRENAVFRVETKAGLAVLRIHRPHYHSYSEISAELSWMAYLANAGMKVPAPFANSAGELLSIIHGDEHSYVVDLLSWVNGQPLGKSNVPLAHSEIELQTIFTGVGQNLAQLHNLSDAWEMPKDFHRHALDKQGLLGEKAAWGKFWEASVHSQREMQLMSEARQLAGVQLDELVSEGADYGLIHADLVRENIFVDGGKIRFIDFDDAGFGFRMFDLAVALIKNREEPHFEMLKSALFSGYKAHREISIADENSLDLFLALRDFAYLGWADARRNEPSMARRIEKIKHDTLLAAQKFLNV